MGSNESIIYGQGHGTTYQDVPQPNGEDGTDVPYYPNGMIIRSWPEHGHLSIGVQRYNEFGNPVQGTEINKLIGSLWADLDRDGINRLIRDLRRHRDRVFGKDE